MYKIRYTANPTQTQVAEEAFSVKFEDKKNKEKRFFLKTTEES